MIFDEGFMAPLFGFLERCKGVEQRNDYHLEGDVFVHSVQVMGWAFRETNDTDLILAAMLHDIGKYENNLGHEKIAMEWLRGHVSAKTLWLIEHHMRIWYLILGEMKRLSKARYLLNHPWLPELVSLARWDKLGRNPNRRIEYDRRSIIERLNSCADKHFISILHEINYSKSQARRAFVEAYSQKIRRV